MPRSLAASGVASRAKRLPESSLNNGSDCGFSTCPRIGFPRGLVRCSSARQSEILSCFEAVGRRPCRHWSSADQISHCDWIRTRLERKQPFGHGGSEGLLNLLVLQRSAEGSNGVRVGSPSQITISDHHFEPLGITRYGHRVEAVGIGLGLALGLPTEVLEVVRSKNHIGIEGLFPGDGLSCVGGHPAHD